VFRPSRNGDALVRDTRQICADLHRGDHLPHIGCERMKPNQQIHPVLINLFLKSVDLLIVCNDPVAKLAITIEQSLKRSLVSYPGSRWPAALARTMQPYVSAARLARSRHRHRRRSFGSLFAHRLGARQPNRRLHLAGFRTPSAKAPSGPYGPLQPQTSDANSLAYDFGPLVW
jgi:hypothetical protein